MAMVMPKLLPNLMPKICLRLGNHGTQRNDSDRLDIFALIAGVIDADNAIVFGVVSAKDIAHSYGLVVLE